MLKAAEEITSGHLKSAPFPHTKLSLQIPKTDKPQSMHSRAIKFKEKINKINKKAPRRHTSTLLIVTSVTQQAEDEGPYKRD